MKLEKKTLWKEEWGPSKVGGIFFGTRLSLSPFLPGHKSLIAHQPCCIFFGYTTPSFEVTQFCFNGFRSLNKIFHHFFSIITLRYHSWILRPIDFPEIFQMQSAQIPGAKLLWLRTRPSAERKPNSCAPVSFMPPFCVLLGHAWAICRLFHVVNY